VLAESHKQPHHSPAHEERVMIDLYQLQWADITLASLLRPLRIVPHFSHHPRLQSLFAWQERLFREHGREGAYPYETAIRAYRERSGWMRGRVRWMRSTQDSLDAPTSAPSGWSSQVARNDIHQLNRWMLPLGLPAYLTLRWFSGVGRVRYTPAPFGRGI
jgi:glutathione S-transferase